MDCIPGRDHIQRELTKERRRLIDIQPFQYKFTILPTAITESAGVKVTQGVATGTLKTALSNELTLAVSNTPTIAEMAGVTVSQGDVDIGTLKTTLLGGATSVVIEIVSGMTILIIGGGDITIGT